MIDLKKSIKNDYKIFDNLVTLRLVHRTTQSVDYDNRTINSGKDTRDVPGCLIRLLSDRESGTVRQIFERGKAIAADELQFMDTVIDIPRLDDLVIEIKDTIQEIVDGKLKRTWQVLSVDGATLDTRYRLGCRAL